MWQEPLAIPGGDRQSPIDIAVRKSVFDSELKPLVYDYDPQTCQQIWNNGYSFLVEYDDTTDKSSECLLVSISSRMGEIPQYALRATPLIVLQGY